MFSSKSTYCNDFWRIETWRLE